MAAKTRHRSRAEAYNLGAAGENAPDWVMSDEPLREAFEQGKADGDHPLVAGPTHGGRTKTVPKKWTPTTVPFQSFSDEEKKAPARTSAPPTSSGPAPGSKPATTRPTTSTIGSGPGDGGGLLLAILLYPLLISTAKYGASGPGMWLKAKFLNQVSTPPPSGGVTGTVH